MARTDPRRPLPAMDALWRLGSLCGVCTGARDIWCPVCCGFEGCLFCRETRRVACPECAGGALEPIAW